MDHSLSPDVQRSVELYQAFLKNNGIRVPDIHAVLGSGIGSSFIDSWIPSNWKWIGDLPFKDLPAITAATAPGHPGIYKFFKETTSGNILCLQVGRLHGYEGLPAEEVVLSVMVPRIAGTHHFVITNAAGGLKLEWPVGSVMMIRDHVNLTGQNPLTGHVKNGLGGKPMGPRFPDLSRAWDREFTEELRTELASAGLPTSEGIYLGVTGPSFETPAEIRLFAQWGMGSVGMSTVWEAIALVHSGARVAGFSLISNLGCGLNPGVILDHFEILEASKAAAEKITRALFKLGAKAIKKS